MMPSSFQWCSVPVQETIGTNCNTGSCLNIRNHFVTVSDGTLTQVVQRGCGVSPLETLKTIWTWARHPTLGVPMKAGDGPDGSKGFYHPQPCGEFCDLSISQLLPSFVIQ